MSLPLNALRAFVAAASGGGVRSASRELGIAHSSISRHIAELESWLGVALLDRSAGPRAFLLTPSGKRLAHTAEMAFKSLELAAAEVRESRTAFAVTVATTASMASRWLMPALPDLARAHPRITLSVQVEQRVLDPGETGADFSIRMGEGPWPEVHAEPLMDDVLLPVVSAALWERSGLPPEISSLARLPLLHDRDPFSSWERWRDKVGPPDLDVRTGSRLTSSDLVARAATQGLGVALARQRLVVEELESGVLVAPFGQERIHVPNAYWIVVPPGPVRPAVKTVITWLREVAQRTRLQAR